MPAPRMSTFAGRMVPAAVVIIGRKEPYALAATMAALYPITEFCDVISSMDCAELSWRGSFSMATPTRPAFSIAAT